eukprot:TRINITY_DN17273_c0_g1_i18.p1 TRINITY_DN17273_c0_g1~~TRINITY_DN17273_c0_g1_i18.p1  ORF type:complete len:187 (+),score=13.03 TRINITY_DN17273_c0_g1_i18:150-710(+)
MAFEYWQLLSHALEQTVSRSSLTWTSTSHSFSPTISPFDSKTAPAISVHHYLERFHRYANCSSACFPVAYIYMKRVLGSTGFVLSRLNIHRLMLAAVVLAIKYVDDEYADNRMYALIGGVKLEEINRLEGCLLALLRFKLFIKQETYLEVVNRLIKRYEQSHAAFKEKGVDKDLSLIHICRCRRAI